MGPPSAFIGLGSNLDEPLRQLEDALSELEAEGVDVAVVSSWYRTEPVGAPPQPWFLNGAAGVRFGGTPEELLHICQRIESLHGRRRTAPGVPRTLDLDLLLFGSEIRQTPLLTLPHPRLAERRFVLVPLVEIAPAAIEPISGLDLRTLLARCPDSGAVVRRDDSRRPVVG